MTGYFVDDERGYESHWVPAFAGTTGKSSDDELFYAAFPSIHPFGIEPSSLRVYSCVGLR